MKTEQELVFHYAGLAMQAMIDSSVSRSPGQLVDAAFNYAEWMLAEAYRRNRMHFSEHTYKSVIDKHNVLTGVEK